MAYATIEELQLGFRTLTEGEKTVATALLDEVAIIIDAYNSTAKDEVKKVVSCRSVRRAIGNGEDSLFPTGTTQGSFAGNGYSNSWTVGSGGSFGELYLSRLEKKLLGTGNKIGSKSPLEFITCEPDWWKL